MCDSCKIMAPDETCDNCFKGKSGEVEELCDACFKKKLAKHDLRKEMEKFGV